MYNLCIYNSVNICIYIYAYNGLNRISVSKNISICDFIRFYRYCILVFDLLHRVTNIRIFRFESKRIMNRIKKLRIFCPSYP